MTEMAKQMFTFEKRGKNQDKSNQSTSSRDINNPARSFVCTESAHVNIRQASMPHHHHDHDHQDDMR